jgi:microcystin-dependent protein
MPDFTKIILRLGVENDRASVVYSEGEPLYITDFKRLFLGDGTTSGGTLASNKFIGFANFDYNTNATGVTYAYQGDLVFDVTSSNLFALTGNAPANLTSYARVTRNFTADNNTTVLTQVSAIAVKTFSLNSDYFSNTIYGRGLEKNGTRIQLANPATNGGLGFDISGKLKITDRSVTNAMLEGMNGNTVKGNLGAAGDIEDIPLQTLADVIAPLLVGVNTNFGVPIGTIIDFGGLTPPVGYLTCNGSAVSTSTYPDLFAAIGYTWGGSGSSFNLPDLRRKTTVGSGGTETTTLSSYVGAVGGTENTILQKENIPSHSHTYDAVSDGGVAALSADGGDLQFNTFGTGDGTLDGLNVGPLGEPFSTYQPSAVVMKCIKAF